jgi:AcrR family transcriptional regulator
MARKAAMSVEDRRAKILDSASRVFAVRGFEGARIADIAEAAEMSQGLVYRYFPSKEALFDALVTESFARLEEAIAALDAMPLSEGEKIVFALEGLIARLEAEEDFARRITLLSQSGVKGEVPDQTRAALTAVRDAPYRGIEAILVRGQAEGSVGSGPPAELALLFWTIIKGLAQHRLAFADFRAPDPNRIARLFLPQPDQKS